MEQYNSRTIGMESHKTVIFKMRPKKSKFCENKKNVTTQFATKLPLRQSKRTEKLRFLGRNETTAFYFPFLEVLDFLKYIRNVQILNFEPKNIRCLFVNVFYVTFYLKTVTKSMTDTTKSSDGFKGASLIFASS